MNRDDDNISYRELFDRYLRNRILTGRDAEIKYDHEAVESVQKILRDPEAGIEFVRQFVEYTATDEDLAYVAAGPINEFICLHHEKIEDSLSVCVRKSPRMRKAIQAVMVSSGKPGEVLTRILTKFGLKYCSW